MQEVNEIGTTTWTREDIKAAIPEFLELYAKKPLEDNQGGMRSPHMFATWFMLKALHPSTVIESGVWKGQGTWLIENTLPYAAIYCIDINLSKREYISHRARYFDQDFRGIDWDFIPDKEDTILFFDDHQDALERVKQGKAFGFKQFIFEDNYPARRGDCYSLKKAFQHAGSVREEQPDHSRLKALLKKLLRPGHTVKPNSYDAAYLKDVLETYYEFPPVFKQAQTRWNDDWEDGRYPTPKALFENGSPEYTSLLRQEAQHYTWICYAKLK